MKTPCLICDRIAQIKAGKNPYFVKELETGYVVLGDHQFFKGYSLLLSKEHACELHELDADFRKQFLEDMTTLAEAVYLAFKPKKLNYELLGNSEPHLHWHIFPRYDNDPRPQGVTWCIDKSIRYAEETKPTNTDLASLKQQLLENF